MNLSRCVKPAGLQIPLLRRDRVRRRKEVVSTRFLPLPAVEGRQQTHPFPYNRLSGKDMGSATRRILTF